MGEERRVIPRKRSVQLAILVLAGATGCASKAGEGTQPGECVDGIDNDENGLLDCADPGCAGSPDCVPQDTAEPEDDTATVPVDTGEARVLRAELALISGRHAEAEPLLERLSLPVRREIQVRAAAMRIEQNPTLAERTTCTSLATCTPSTPKAPSANRRNRG